MMKRTVNSRPIVFVFSMIAVLFALFPVLVQAEGHESTEEVAAETEPEEAAEQTLTADVVQIEGVVTVGSRAQPRSVIESTVPIDVLGSGEFVKQGGTDLNDLLRNVVPSYNINTQPISDAATVVRPANLRGLAPDHTLVLVNGKRRHRASVIYWLGNGISDGAQGPDLSAIPAIALKQVEVLRDGASAQYGSDAIAGVMNFQLRDNYEGLTIETKAGAFQDGDGELYSIAANLGLGRKDLWTNLSVEYGYSGDTIRSVQRIDAEGLIAAGNTRVNDPAQIWGQPEIADDLKLFANYGATLVEDVANFYGHANYATKRVEGGFFFRNPNTRGGVFSKDGGSTLLVGNLSGAGETPVVAITGNVPDAAALGTVKDDDNLFSFQEMFPGGFTPRFGADTRDTSIVAGLRGTVMEKLGWDLSASLGRHLSDFFINNTVNASLGPDTPTEFDPGNYVQQDINLNFDVTYPVMNELFIAAGAEYRIESFEIVQGQEESFEIGPLAEQGFSAASNGFPGFSEVASGTWNRANVAGYVEAEFRPVQNWLLGAAVRGENFDDFGSTLNYKLATNFGVTDELKLRGSFSTGFRAPTPGQQNAFNVTTEFDVENNDLVNNGTIPSTNAAAELKGGEALQPETSINITAGIIVLLSEVNVTLDYFNIEVKDRLSLSTNFELTDAERQQLLAAGITSAGNLQRFRFFVNDFTTRTQGIDVVLTAPVGKGDVSLAYNYTDTEVTDSTDLTGELRIRLLEEGVPKNRWSLTMRHPVNANWDVLGRASYFGGWWEGTLVEHEFSSEMVFDVETTYAFSDTGISLTVGGQNILNNYPDKILQPYRFGNLYGEYSPFGFAGAFWYAKANYNF